MPELYTTPSVADVAMRNHMKGDNMKSERNWRIKMDKTSSEIHDRTRKALMDRIVELERDKKALEEKTLRSTALHVSHSACNRTPAVKYTPGITRQTMSCQICEQSI